MIICMSYMRKTTNSDERYQRTINKNFELETNLQKNNQNSQKTNKIINHIDDQKYSN